LLSREEETTARCYGGPQATTFDQSSHTTTTPRPLHNFFQLWSGCDAFAASRVQHISDLHSKFALPPTLSDRNEILHGGWSSDSSSKLRISSKSVKRFWGCGGQNLPIPIDLAIGLYNSLYYRTSRDTTRKGNHSSFLVPKISAKFERGHPNGGGAKERWGYKQRFSTNIPGAVDRLRRCQLSSPMSVINF